MKVYDISTRRGKHCYVSPLESDPTRALKVFDAYPLKDWDSLDSFSWGDEPKKGQPKRNCNLVHATQIQNICWMHGLAPRVYGIIGVKDGSKKYFAQEIEYLGDAFSKTQKGAYSVYDQVKKLGAKYGFVNEKDDVSRYDVIDGKLIDFNTFHFKKNYLEKIKQRYSEYARYGKKYYHDVEEWGLTGAPRKTEQRIKEMKLDKIDFTDKSVLDLGCAGGAMCRYAKDRGAAKVLGIDNPGHGSDDPIKGAYLASNMLQYWDVEYVDVDICDDLTRGLALIDYDSPDRNDKKSVFKASQYDIVFFLSMNFHIDIPEWLPNVTKEVCVFEDNSKDRNALPILKKLFKRVEKIGKTFDHDKKRGKVIYHCYV